MTTRARRVCVALTLALTLVVASTLVSFIAMPAHVPVAAAAPSTAVPVASAAPTAPSTDVPATDVPATLTDYWNGQANWTLFRQWPESSMPGTITGGISIYIRNGVWYLIHRRDYLGSECKGAPGAGGTPLGVQIRKSTDQGKTWSDPVDMITPFGTTVGGDQEWSCIGTDGDIWYEPSAGPGGTWYYLFQCVKDDNVGAWNGCLATRPGSDPMGSFATPTGVTNPVVPARSIWSKICNQPTDECVKLEGGPGRVGGEGTFRIFKKDAAGYYWVDFSGAGESGYWYNGIAKTKDFVNWVAGDPAAGVPTDAVLYKGLADNWRENWITPPGNVGFGAGSVFEETVGRTTHDYLLAESQDLYGGCRPGQHWDLGLFRTTDLSSSNWQQYPGGNPIAYSSRAPELLDASGNGQAFLCNIQYGQLFRDPADSTVYMTMSRGSLDTKTNGVYVYRLDKMDNLLQNGDFWKANTENWSFTGSTAHAIVRDPRGSPDGLPYLEFSCGGPCGTGQSVYQSVNLSSHKIGPAGQTIQYGGTFATDGSPGKLTVEVDQYDDGGRLLRSDSKAVRVSDTYTGVIGQTTLKANARTLRYRMIPQSPVTYCAGDLFATIGTDTRPVRPSNRRCRIDWVAHGPNISHDTGSAVPGTTEWRAAAGTDSAGYMQSGPYARHIGVGNTEAVWRLKIDNNTGDNAKIATLDVHDASTNAVLASRVVTRKMWTAANTFQDFVLPFVLNSDQANDPIEFRINWTGVGTVTSDRVVVRGTRNYLRCHTLDPCRYHKIGSQYADGWQADPGTDSVGYLGSGPIQAVPGDNVAWTTLMYSVPEIPSYYQTLLQETQHVHDGSNRNIYHVDLSPFLGKEAVYLRFDDALPDDGWGPAVHHVTVKADGQVIASFVPGSADEKAFLYDSQNTQVIGDFRFADGRSYFVYRFAPPAGTQSLTADLDMENEYKVSATNTQPPVAPPADDIATLDIYDATTGTVLASRTLTRGSWHMYGGANTYTNFAVRFSLDKKRVGHVIEMRTYWLGTMTLREQQVSVQRLSVAQRR